MRRQYDHILSNRDYLDLITIGHESLAVNDQGGMLKTINDLKELIGFENCLMALSNINAVLSQSNLDAQCWNLNYPDEYLNHYFENEHYKTDEIVGEFRRTGKAVNWIDVDRKYGLSYPAAVLAHEYGFNQGWTHGNIDPQTSDVFFVYMGGADTDITERGEFTIEFVLPFISDAYKRTLEPRIPRELKMTPKELEVLKWLKEGKSSWETSLILNCSKRVVDFHACNIIDKLGAANRTDAVVKALQLGLISF